MRARLACDRGRQAQRVVDAIPQEQLDALPLGRLDFIGMNIYNSVMVRAGQTASRNSAPGRRAPAHGHRLARHPGVDGVGDALYLGAVRSAYLHH